MRVRATKAGDQPWVEAFLAQNGSSRVARRGELVRPLDFPMLIAEADGARAGLLTFVVNGTDCEVLTLHAVHQWSGAGTALLAAVRDVATDRGCRRLWVVTTNDNVDALRFYQRRGFRLSVVRPGAVDEARRNLKAEIEPVGAYGIPIRDEIELEVKLGTGE
jgi:GNAT superfamily N-acetyltransferase